MRQAATLPPLVAHDGGDGDDRRRVERLARRLAEAERAGGRQGEGDAGDDLAAAEAVGATSVSTGTSRVAAPARRSSPTAPSAIRQAARSP